MTLQDTQKQFLSSTRFLFVRLFFLQVVGEAGERRRPSAAWAESGPGPEAEIAFQPILTKQIGRCLSHGMQRCLTGHATTEFTRRRGANIAFKEKQCCQRISY